MSFLADDSRGSGISTQEAWCMPIIPALLTSRLNWARSFLGKRMRRVPTLAILVSLSPYQHLECSFWVLCSRGVSLTREHSVVHFTFETGDEKLKALENGVFVGAGRFVLETDRPITVEYRISRVVM